MAKKLVLALYENEAAADSAVEALKKWDKASKEVKLGAIGVLVKDDKGKIKTHKLGSRKTGTGAVLLGLAALITGGLSLIGGVVIGAGVGSLFHKGLKISKEEMEQLNKDLDSGKAAVGVMGSPEEASAVAAKLTELGGTTAAIEVSEEAVAQAQEVAADAPAEDAEEAPTDEAADPPAEDAEESAE